MRSIAQMGRNEEVGVKNQKQQHQQLVELSRIKTIDVSAEAPKRVSQSQTSSHLLPR